MLGKANSVIEVAIDLLFDTVLAQDVCEALSRQYLLDKSGSMFLLLEKDCPGFIIVRINFNGMPVRANRIIRSKLWL